MNAIRRITIALILSLIFFNLSSQGFDNATRALYILDISKYVKWTDTAFHSLLDFKIGVLARETQMYWELINAAKTRLIIQQKPIQIFSYRDVSEIEPTQVLFIGNPKDYDISNILKRIKGNHTLLITENCQFRNSMINFIVIDGKPKFEANEKLINEEKMTVSQLFLAQAVKTREEWEQLFTKTEVELNKEKETVKKQNEIIENQKQLIEKQTKEIEDQQKKLVLLDIEIKEKQKVLSQNLASLKNQEMKINSQQKLIEVQKVETENQKSTLQDQKNRINSQISEIQEREKKIKKQDVVLAEKLKLIEKQKIILYFSFVFILLLVFLGYFIYRNYIIKKNANIALEEKNRTIMAQNKEIESQRDIARLQRDQIAFQKRHIMDSIQYAKRIQSAILPSIELFSDRLEHFILYKPKDIVSGDFYWQTMLGDELILVVSDCTGHGVPGAFMSMLGISLLNEIVNKQMVTSPDIILNHLRNEIINCLRQSEKAELKDGMDITICNVNYAKNRLLFAGANNPLYFIRNNEISEIKGDKMPVAIHEIMKPFTLHELSLEKGDVFYTFSDGYSDQFGGNENKKYMSRNFKCAILELHKLPMLKQGEKLNLIFEEWRGENEQLDDVTVVGIRY
jgi:serine phosphatase RsbU (regulator of sigma subunit)